jgi:hypothetical protein
MAAGSTERAEFRVPDSELDGSAALRAAEPPAARLSARRSDKILFPRQMIYIEALLYLLIASASFGMGYLMGRGGGVKATSGDNQETVVGDRVPLEGTVTLETRSGDKRPEAGAVVVVLPVVKPLDKTLPVARLHPNEPAAGPKDAVTLALKALGGATTRTDEKGRFTLFVPHSGSYRILILSSRQKSNEIAGTSEKPDRKQLSTYFASPDELLLNNCYKWYSREVQANMKPIEAKFTE